MGCADRPTHHPAQLGASKKGGTFIFLPSGCFRMPSFLPSLPHPKIGSLWHHWRVAGRKGGPRGGENLCLVGWPSPSDMYNCAELAVPSPLPSTLPSFDHGRLMPPALPSLSLPSCFPFFPCLYPHTFCTTAEGRGKEEKALPPPVLVACLHPRDSLSRSWDRQLLSLRHRRSCLFLRNAVTERKVLRRKRGDRKRALPPPPQRKLQGNSRGRGKEGEEGGNVAAASRSHRVVVFCATFPRPTDPPALP